MEMCEPKLPGTLWVTPSLLRESFTFLQNVQQLQRTLKYTCADFRDWNFWVQKNKLHFVLLINLAVRRHVLQTALQESVVESKEFPKPLGADCFPLVLTT
jgi:hypothetical protein